MSSAPGSQDLASVSDQSKMSCKPDRDPYRAENGVVLKKVFGFTEIVFMEVQASWNRHQITWLANEHGAQECHERLIRVMRKLQAVISRYGYLSESTDVWSSSNPVEWLTRVFFHTGLAEHSSHWQERFTSNVIREHLTDRRIRYWEVFCYHLLATVHEPCSSKRWDVS